WYFANCAWDSVAFHAMLNEEIRIGSQCHHCAESISITLANGRATASPRETRVYLSLPAAKWWDDILNTCSNHMVFFRGTSHIDDWRSANPAAADAALTIEQTHALSVPLYRDRLKLEYVRPSKDELVAHFASLGLTGPFWNPSATPLPACDRGPDHRLALPSQSHLHLGVAEAQARFRGLRAPEKRAVKSLAVGMPSEGWPKDR